MADFLKPEILSRLPKGTITPFELEVLLLKRRYSSMTQILRGLKEKYPKGVPGKKKRETEMDDDDVAGVGHRIRERRRNAQLVVNFYNNLAKDKRLYRFITPIPRNYDEEKLIEEDDE